MSNKIAARNKKAGVSPSQEAKRVDTAANVRLGEMLGVITGRAVEPARLEGLIQESVELINQAIVHGAPGTALSILDGFVRALHEAKKGA